MGWNCINCESANDDSVTECLVCGYERYFSVTEVNEFFEQMKASPTEIKKIETNFKRASTTNKKLRKENKELLKEMEELQDFHDNYNHNVQNMEEQLQRVRKSNLQLKILLVISTLIILFFFFVKVDIDFIF